MISLRSPATTRGFTLIEAIMVIVITGILAGIVAVFITKPVQGYVDSARRAEMTDAADIALRRLVREVRLAVPNSLRVDCASAAGWFYLEFVPTKDGGRYRNQGDGSTSCGGSCLCTAGNAVNTTFDVLGVAPGSSPSAVANDFVVVDNDASLNGDSSCSTPSNVYCGGSRARVRSTTPAAVGTAAMITTYTAFANSSLICPYINNRYQIVDQTTKAVTYACPTTAVGTLTRYWNYNGSSAAPDNGFNAVQPTPPTGGSFTPVVQNATCVIDYTQNVQQLNGLLYIKLTIADSASGESVVAFRQIHVDNTP